MFTHTHPSKFFQKGFPVFPVYSPFHPSLCIHYFQLLKCKAMRIRQGVIMKGERRANPITWIFLFHSNKGPFCDSKGRQLQCCFHLGGSACLFCKAQMLVLCVQEDAASISGGAVGWCRLGPGASQLLGLRLVSSLLCKYLLFLFLRWMVEQ